MWRGGVKDFFNFFSCLVVAHPFFFSNFAAVIIHLLII